MPPPASPRFALIVAVAAISTAAVLVRLAPGVEPLGAAFWRTLIVGVLLSPGILRFRHTGGLIGQREISWTLLAGLLLGLHFWAWFESISQTTILRSTLLVCLTPVWAGLMEWGLLGQRAGRNFWVGIGITLVGVSLLTESGPGGTSWSGDLLALLGGILGAAYMLVGRVVRKRLDIDAYGALLCLACAAWILVFATLTEVPLRGFSQTDWMVLGAMAMGPQLFGHMGLNYAVRYMPAAIVTSALLLEPVGAALLGALVPSIAEIPTPLAILGGLVALIGVGLATRIAPEGTAPESSPRDLQADAAGSSPSHESVHAGD